MMYMTETGTKTTGMLHVLPFTAVTQGFIWIVLACEGIVYSAAVCRCCMYVMQIVQQQTVSGSFELPL